jgi:Flp pilus assembly protein CpaB
VAELQERRANLKSAVLAVNEMDVPRLMTAATMGHLRLALRPPAAFDANAQLGQGKPKPNVTLPPSTTLDMTVKRPKPDGKGIIIQEGGKEHSVDDSNKNFFF